MITARRVLIGASGVLVAASVLGFVVFAAAVTREPGPDPRGADGIVVLTGGDLRIREGARLLRKGHARRLLITGINRVTGRRDLLRLSGLGGPQFDCCVDLDYRALDTVGNADQTRAWAAERRFKRLIVVTSSYHMPRSLAELSLAMPDVALIPHPVRSRRLGSKAWWLDASAMRVLLGEYIKFLPVAARLTVTRIARPWDDSSVAQYEAGRTRT